MAIRLSLTWLGCCETQESVNRTPDIQPRHAGLFVACDLRLLRTAIGTTRPVVRDLRAGSDRPLTGRNVPYRLNWAELPLITRSGRWPAPEVDGRSRCSTVTMRVGGGVVAAALLEDY